MYFYKIQKGLCYILNSSYQIYCVSMELLLKEIHSILHTCSEISLNLKFSVNRINP